MGFRGAGVRLHWGDWLPVFRFTFRYFSKLGSF